MKIAQVAPIIERVPPKKYGGTERIIYTLTEELVKMGHDVTLFASGDSKTSAELSSGYPKNLREAKIADLYGLSRWSLLHFGSAYNRAKEFDIIHDHTYLASLPTANLSPVPVVMTLHGAITDQTLKLYEEFNTPYLVTISRAQSQFAPHLNYIDNVYHGLTMKHYPFSNKSAGYLLYVGRISPQKGVHLAIKTAKRLKLPLIIAAKLDILIPADLGYFKSQVEPELSDRIVWIGEVDEQKRNELMSNALCFLHPVIWNEPFGLTLIESMACGTPVVAFDKGSIPEIVKDGKTGFVVDTVEEMVEAVKKVGIISREYCRRYALRYFSGSRMARDYVDVYKRVLSLKRLTPHPNQVRPLPRYISFAHVVDDLPPD